MALNNKQRIFIDEYLLCWNAAEAARRAGYSEATARSIGAENLTKPDIKAAIEQRLRDSAMSADEVVARLTEQARGALSDFIVTNLGHAYVDMDAAKEAGKLHLIKKLNYDENGRLRGVEFYDAQSALVQLGRIRGLFIDRADITTDGKPLLAPIIYLPDINQDTEESTGKDG